MKVSLGTAQLGTSYGISNRKGQPTQAVAEALLRQAVKSGIELLDTAPAYGDSERLIGSALPSSSSVRIVTKAWGGADPEATVKRFRQSLRDLRRSSVDTLLVHSVEDLKGSASKRLVAALQELQEEGLTSNLGVSIYDPKDLLVAQESMPIDVVELPLNVFDQRFLRNGTIASLAANNIEVHARSVFLQGLLLMAPRDVPRSLQGAVPALEEFHAQRSEAGLSAIEGAIGLMAEASGLESVIVGVNSSEELIECLTAAAASNQFDYSCSAIDDPTIIDPRRWHSPHMSSSSPAS